MDIKIEIGKINLGKDVAEQETRELPKYFLSTRAYLNAKDISKKKLFYIANRGSGKSALFNQLAYEYSDSSKKNIVFQISPNEYSYETFKKLEHDFIDVKSAYTVAWRYTLLVEIFKETSKYFDKYPNIKSNRENIKVINKFLLDHKLKDAETKLEVFFKILSKVDVSKLNIKFKGVEIQHENSKKNADELMNIFNLKDLKKPDNALKRILIKYPVYIFIDELDTGWNNSKEAKNFINGLISASLYINAYENVNVFLSLRQDMYNNLSEVFSDAEKIRGQIEFLNWDKETLVGIICKRIKDNKEVRYKTKNIEYLSNIEVLNFIFEEKAFDFILESTLYRPREVINLCKYSIEKYHETYRSRNLYNKKIEIDTIKLVIHQFSTDRFNDFCAEYNYEFPYIKELLIQFEGKKSTYEKKELVDILQESIMSFSEVSNDFDWANKFFDYPEKLLIRLFEIGFFRICTSTNKLNFFAYYEKKPLSYRNINQVQINTIFARALDCSDLKI